jgi:uncharacterized surface protein with fasciclin (FAS1) repeats
MSKVKTSMAILKRPMNALLVAALVVGLFGTVIMMPPVGAAPVAQTVQSQEVAGTLTGGQSAQIWLGLQPDNPGASVRVHAVWDRERPTDNGLGFYVLTESQTRAVVGGSSLQNNNLAVGTPFAAGPNNEIDASFGATACPCTIVLSNSSATDASFVLSVDNGVLIDDAGQVRDNLAPATEEDADAEVGEEAEAEAEAVETEVAEEEAVEEAEDPAPVAVEAEDEEAVEEAETEVDDTEADEVDSAQEAEVLVSGEVRSPVMEGELPEQFQQHFFAFEPHGRDVNVRIVMAFDPQDQSELARNMNFWVMDDSGFRRYVDPSSNAMPGSLAFAAGNTSTSVRANERIAEFGVPGSGSLVVIVYNNSQIPASYTLSAEGGVFMDDAQQSLTAQRSLGTAPAADTDEVDAEDTGDVDTTTTTTTTATTTPAATSTRTGEPGGIYVVQSGDTLSLIARDVLGNMSAWRDICNLNELANCNRIEVGMELQLPTLDQIGTTQAPATTQTTTTTTTTATATTTATTTADEEDEADEVDEVDEVDEADDEADEADEEEAADDDADEAEAGNGVDLIAALRAAGGFDTMVEALEAANLDDALVTGGPFTIFAPTDAAFDALPAGAMEQLLNQPTGQLTQILLFHVLPGRVGSDDVSDGMQATTQQGRSVRFELDGGEVLVNGASVVVPDISASNGVIHAIDAVILPPTD